MLAISPSFADFLQLLAAKKEGEPLIHWQDDIDFLTVLIGNGDCREHCLSGIICSCTDILLKLHSKEDEDAFAGFQMWGGVQGFLKNHYKKLLGAGYAEFAIRHNNERHAFHASELLDLWLKEYPAIQSEQVARIQESLKSQNPYVHIPL